MDTFSPLQQLSIVILGLLILASAVWVVCLRNLFRAALSLGLVLIGVAGMFLVLRAEFLALTQILVYVGAILTLVVFAVMLTANAKGDALSLPTRRRVPAAALCVTLFAVLTGATNVIGRSMPAVEQPVPLAQLGRELITTLVLPFELISLVFVAAIVGAIALAAAKARGQSPS